MTSEDIPLHEFVHEAIEVLSVSLTTYCFVRIVQHPFDQLTFMLEDLNHLHPHITNFPHLLRCHTLTNVLVSCGVPVQ